MRVNRTRSKAESADTTGQNPYDPMLLFADPERFIHDPPRPSGRTASDTPRLPFLQ
jgi:hypothetical protein